MKTLASSPKRDFDIYLPKSLEWGLREQGDSLAELYAAGYLPYSGSMGLRDVFYRGRSARIVLPEFKLSSENRRIARKFDGQFTKELVRGFVPDEAFYEFCIAYFAQKHGPSAMPRDRLETLFDSGLITGTLIYRSAGKPVAYVLEVSDGEMAHYWFSFYDLAYARQSLGLWLMLDCIRDAEQRGLKNYYLGTVYGPNALYKTNFAPLEWRGEAGWSRDIQLLKSLI